ncbi:MAG TPA: SPOR domain-containing protein [candidate division Zixibacteria bacterium]|nr:SPOR domain-containing protein [candidate division Zixibacteria bacterium]
MKRFVLVVAVLLIGATNPKSETIYGLIAEGNLKQALDSISQVSTASTRDGNILFYASLLEPDADKAAQLMEAALSASVSAQHREQIYYRLAHYWYLKGDYSKLGGLVADYQAMWEAGNYRAEMQRFAILLDERNQEYEAAVRQADRYLLSFKKGIDGQWGRLDKARIMSKNGKKIAARKLLRELSREDGGPGVPTALYLLAEDAIETRKTDDAVFFYNLLREGYPSAVGLGALIEAMTGMSTPDAANTQAEEITGTYYSVKVGVFSVEENAKKLAEEFRQYGKPVDVIKKKISTTTYDVVMVGHFKDFAEASRFKDQIQAEHNEVFQVVAR